MIRISRDDLLQIASEFEKHLSDYLGYGKKDKGNYSILTKIDKYIIDAKVGHRLKLSQMLAFYRNYKDRMASIQSVRELEEINAEFCSRFQTEISIWKATPERESKTYKGILKKDTDFGMFQIRMKKLYEGFMKSSLKGYVNKGHWLAKRLNVTTCPYCNRHYTFTISKTAIGKTAKQTTVIRPQFDHFFPKSLYPITALCFYNLVPACAECNHTKEDDMIAIHPYEDSFSANGIYFYIDPLSSIKNPLVRLTKEDNPNVAVMALSELYREHGDLASDICNKAIAYSNPYYESLIRSFGGLGLDESGIQRIVWGTSLNEDEEMDRPFSKLTRDILTQYGLRLPLCSSAKQ